MTTRDEVTPQPDAKTRPSGTDGKPELVFPTFQEVRRRLLALPEEVDARVMAGWRERHGSQARWSVADRAKMAEAITRVEDQLELAVGRKHAFARPVLKALRRELEDSCE